MVFFVRIAVVAIVLLIVVVVFFVRIDVVVVVLLVVKLRRCKGKIFFFFFFTVNVNRVLETQFTSRCHVEKNANSDPIRTCKPSLKGSIYRPKIEPLRLELLINDIVSKLGLLTI